MKMLSLQLSISVTYFKSALSIIENNEFRLEVNDWPYDEGKRNINGIWYEQYGEKTNIPPKYMLCTTRIKNSNVGYSSAFQKRFNENSESFARIELDEDALSLNNNLIVRSENDCKTKLHINDFKNLSNYDNNWQFQHEERILSTKNFIKNAYQYIRKIEFLITNNEDILALKSIVKNNSIFLNKIFIYHNMSDFNNSKNPITISQKKLYENIQSAHDELFGEIPDDSGWCIDRDRPKVFFNIYDFFNVFKYFGDCKNTVDIDKIWDATQMAQFINNCNLVKVSLVYNKLLNGDRKIPKALLKALQTTNLNNLSEICAGFDVDEKILFIYLTKTDTHYFFDCENIQMPEFLYHATPSCRVSSIRKLGLGGKMPRKRLWDYKGTQYEKITKGVFLANDEYIAYDYVDNSDEFEELCDSHEDDVDIIVFQIKLKDLDFSKLGIDYNQEQDEEIFSFFYEDVIPYEKLKKIKLNECLSSKYINSLNENLSQKNGLYKFQNWEEFQNSINDIGWENFVLYNSYKRNHAWKRKSSGHYVMNMKEPRENSIYYAWYVNGKPLAITNIYVCPEEIWIGDFEVSKFHKGEGLGKLLFKALKDEYPNMNFVLTYRDIKAKLFWEKMGFIASGQGSVMSFSNENKLLENYENTFKSHTLYHSSRELINLLHNEPMFFALDVKHAINGWAKNIKNEFGKAYVYKYTFINETNIVNTDQLKDILSLTCEEIKEYENMLVSNPSEDEIMTNEITIKSLENKIDGIIFSDYDPRDFQKDLNAVIIFKPKKCCAEFKLIKCL